MVKTEINDGIAFLTLNDGKVNALTLDLMNAFTNGLEEIHISEAKAVIVTGTCNSFSAGIDLVKMLKEGDEYRSDFGDTLNQFLRHIITFEKPVIAAVNGHAVAGGCILTAACDYRIMADTNIKIGVTELKVGVPFPSVPMEVLRHVVHQGFLSEVAYLGKLYSPQEGMERGLVNEVVPPDELMDRALEVANELGNAPLEAFRLVKASINLPVMDRIARHDNVLKADMDAYWKSNEVRNNMRSFMDKITKGK